MNVRDVIVSLSAAEGPSRKLDGHIATFVGWQKKMEQRADRPNGNIIEIGVWYRPDGSEARKVPFYTESLQAAYELVRQFAPDDAAACTFGPSGGKAQIEMMEPVFAKTPPLALCLAALRYVERMGFDPGTDS